MAWGVQAKFRANRSFTNSSRLHVLSISPVTYILARHFGAREQNKAEFIFFENCNLRD